MKNRLKELREQANLTQEQLGAAIGKSQEIISLYENGFRMPNIKVCILLAQRFGCRVEDIFVP